MESWNPSSNVWGSGSDPCAQALALSGSLAVAAILAQGPWLDFPSHSLGIPLWLGSFVSFPSVSFFSHLRATKLQLQLGCTSDHDLKMP